MRHHDNDSAHDEMLARELAGKLKRIRDRLVPTVRYLETLEVQLLALIVAARANGAGPDLLRDPLALMASESLSGLTRDAARKELENLAAGAGADADADVDVDSDKAGIELMKRAARGEW